MSVYSLLKRETSGRNFIPEIDGLRFLAIITVVLFHFRTAFTREIDGIIFNDLSDNTLFHLMWWIDRFDLGVKLFFVISGFILCVPFYNFYALGKGKVELKSYFIRRLTRLEPPFIISLLLFYAVHVMVLNVDAGELFPNLLASLFYMHCIVFGMPSLINPVTWSLETEVQFYILIPFLAYFIWKNTNKWISYLLIIILIVGSAFFRNFTLSEDPFGWSYTVLVYLSNFMVGALLASLYCQTPSFFKRRSYIWDFVALGSIVVLFTYYKPQADVVNNLIFNFALFFIFLSAFKSILFNKFLTIPWVYIIGGMCYTIYLIHFPFFFLWSKISVRFLVGDDYLLNLIIHGAVGTTAMLIVSSLFFILFEKPFMNKHWPAKVKSFFNKAEIGQGQREL
ncbi:acyltransferase family protein [Algoriphagus sp.]|uniref:acyltransferase family protein n=1 Tax=Algoriphagus sp. TaxID=1872435 RepID=UPI003F72E7A1